MSMRGTQKYNIFSAKATIGTSAAINVKDYRNCVIKVGTASSASLTVKCQGSISSFTSDATAPDFSAAATVANNWTNIQLIDLNDGTPVTGTTGIVLSGTDVFKIYEINVNALDFIAFTITARAAGTITIDVLLTDNL